MMHMTALGEVAKRTARLLLLAGLAASGYVDGTASARMQPNPVAVDPHGRIIQPVSANTRASRATLSSGHVSRFRLQTATLAQAVRDFERSSFVLHPNPPPSIKASIRNDVISAMNAYDANSKHPRPDANLALRNSPDSLRARQGTSAYLGAERTPGRVMRISSIR
jgi:hypothetical protein